MIRPASEWGLVAWFLVAWLYMRSRVKRGLVRAFPTTAKLDRIYGGVVVAIAFGVLLTSRFPGEAERYTWLFYLVPPLIFAIMGIMLRRQKVSLTLWWRTLALFMVVAIFGFVPAIFDYIHRTIHNPRLAVVAILAVYFFFASVAAIVLYKYIVKQL
jgi:hypothetical protein